MRCELYEQTHQEGKETVQPQEIALVSEKDYEYAADAFEEFMTKQKDKYIDESPIDIPSVKKDEKER